MELNEALHQITEIRQQMARSQVFRGYRSATTTFSGLIAIAAALLQTLLVPNPAQHPLGYVLLWVIAASLSLVVVAAEIIMRGGAPARYCSAIFPSWPSSNSCLAWWPVDCSRR